MLNKIRNISARITLLVYLTSFLAVALFHYHDYLPLAEGNHTGVIIIVSHQDTGEKSNDIDHDRCSLCLITNVQFDSLSNEFPSVNYSENQLFSVVSSDISIPFIDYSLKRAPPIIVY
jgi:hypothetical protein